MRILTGQYERTVDANNRLQFPSQLRSAFRSQEEQATGGLYVTLGEHRGTLSVFPQQAFEDLAARMETECMPGPETRRFELQFYGVATYIDMDRQGRVVLPDRLVKKAGLSTDVLLVGQKYRIDIWDRSKLERSMGIDWEGDDWPEWQWFLRMKPSGSNDTSTESN